LTWKQPVIDIAIKIAAVGSHGRWVYAIDGTTVLKKNIEDPDNFLKEMLFQTDIFLNSSVMLKQMTPAPIYFRISDLEEDTLMFISDLKTKTLGDPDSEFEANAILVGLLKGRINKIGVLAMELTSLDRGFNRMIEYRRHPNFQLIKDMARFQIINMAIKLGYVHLDFHGGNILIKAGHSGLPEDVFIIDFGRCIKIAEEVRIQLESLYMTRRYGELIERFKDFEYDGTKMGDWLVKYGYDGYAWFWEATGSIDSAVRRFEDLYALKRAAMLRHHISRNTLYQNITHFFGPEPDMSGTGEHITKALRDIQTLKTRYSQKLKPPISRMATKLSQNRILAAKTFTPVIELSKTIQEMEPTAIAKSIQLTPMSIPLDPILEEDEEESILPIDESVKYAKRISPDTNIGDKRATSILAEKKPTSSVRPKAAARHTVGRHTVGRPDNEYNKTKKKY
jgi:hypothetical protein